MLVFIKKHKMNDALTELSRRFSIFKKILLLRCNNKYIVKKAVSTSNCVFKQNDTIIFLFFDKRKVRER